MFLRVNQRKKNGKLHRYFSVVENRRLGDGQSVQRQVMYLGEINDSQQAAWRKTLEVFDEERGQYQTLSLFPDDRPLPGDAVNAVSVKLSEMRLLRPRSFGDCWLGCLLWDELHLSAFWEPRLADARAEVPWTKVLQLLVVNRLIDPGSEWRVHRQWFCRSAMDELLGVDFAVAAKDRLYRCLDRLLGHKDELCKFLTERWKTLFHAQFDVLLYDLTSTYFEGLCEEIPKAKHGYSRDGRGDCRQVVIALVVTPDGLPLAYEVLAGNTADSSTLTMFLEKIQSLYGKARRIWVMDRGIPSEATLRQMRQQEMQYLVGTPKTMLSKLEKDLLDKLWEQVHEGMKVKLLSKEGELYVLACSADRQAKERAMRRRKFKRLVRGLHALRRRCPDRDTLLGRLAVLTSEAGRVAALVQIHVPATGEAVTRQSFTYSLHSEKLLALRPIYHSVAPRVEAHILVAFLGYCLSATLRKKLEVHAPGLTPKAVLEQLGSIQMVDVCLPTTDGRWLIMPRYTEPEADQLALLDRMRLALPPQPPPRLRAGRLLLGAES